MKSRLLVSVHDVWPGNLLACEEILRGLASRGVRKIAWMIVPDYRGNGELVESPDFVEWAKYRHAEGQELFVHGWKHQMHGNYRRTSWGRWVNSRLTRGESELSGLSWEDRFRIAEGACRLFDKAGLPFIGFTPPTWFGALRKTQLRALGLRYQDTRWGIMDSHADRMHGSIPLVWPAEPSARGSRGGAFFLKVARYFPLLRMAIHPQDLRQKDFWPTVDALLPERRTVKYAEL